MQSILQHEKKCFVCDTTEGLETHHCIYGDFGAKRDLAEEYGLTVWLCHRHHRDSTYGVHFNKEFDLSLKKFAQTEYEKHYTEPFIKVFGEDYK